MHDERRLVEARLRRELRERIEPAIHGRRRLVATESSDLPGEPVPVTEIADAAFAPIEPGTPWGRPWGTTWFRATGLVPEDWTSLSADSTELIVELGFNDSGPGFQAEGLVYQHGIAVRGVHPRRRSVPLGDARPGAPIELLLEAAANPDINRSHRPTALGSPGTAGATPLYVFGGIWLAERNDEVDALVRDLEVLGRLVASLPDDDARRHRVTTSIEVALDTLDLHDVASTAAAARAALAPALGVPARAGEHRIFAIGHAHIDTAWLWPIRETHRKCARTFANALELMDRYPEYRFACSQAAQHAWIEEEHPELFERIRAKVADGRWIPVGGMWVEADMNLPSGESIARQLVHGQRWFESRFGKRSTEVWIPDVFGYPGSLPQIFAAAGCTSFVTQKLSWNKQNRMPHNTFWWEGIDGSRVLTHFPPVDTYNAEMHADENRFAAHNFAEKAWSNASIVPFGYGDGGGGPTPDMLERARRMADLDGAPIVEIAAPEAFFALVREEAEAAGSAVPAWRGELYFETHRGTLTSQIATKDGNRRCERLLREVELCWALIGDAQAYAPVQAELDALWKDVLLQQFHDIIPGSSIGWVHADAEAAHARVARRLEELINDALDRVCGNTGPGNAAPSRVLALNPATHARREVAIVGADLASTLASTVDASQVQHLDGGRLAVRIDAPGLGLGGIATSPCGEAVRVDSSSMENGHLRVQWDASGRLTSIVSKSTGREILPPGRFGAELTIAPDHPVEYDAWDVERWTPRRATVIDDNDAIRVDARGPLAGEVSVVRSFGRSRVTTTYRLTEGSPRLDVELDMDWHEDEKLLAICFPIDVHSPVATCGIQFGSVERPRHENTSWDLAKFEVCAHRWVDVAEPTFGVAVLDDGRYGHSLHGDGVRVTLLRAPSYPDPTADRGRHRTTLSILPHGAGRGAVVREAERLNVPIRFSAARTTAALLADAPLIELGRSGDGIEVSAAKLADDGSGDLIVRVAEMCGDRHRVELRAAHPIRVATFTDLLEEPTLPLTAESGRVQFDLRPFQLATLRLSSEPR